MKNWERVLIGLLISALCLCVIGLSEQQSDLQKVATWQSALVAVEPGTGMILSSDDREIELGQKYHIPVNSSDQITIISDVVFTPFHNYTPTINQVKMPTTLPKTLWYFNSKGKIIGFYMIDKDSAPNVDIFLQGGDPDFNCPYWGVAKFNTYTVGGLLVEEVWDGGDGKWSRTCH